MVIPIQAPSPFPTRMKAAREKLGISQMEVGVRAGIEECSASARINQYERGKHAPDFLTVRNLAKVLSVPTAYFYAEDDYLAALLMLLGEMKNSERKTVLHFTESLLANKTQT